MVWPLEERVPVSVTESLVAEWLQCVTRPASPLPPRETRRGPLLPVDDRRVLGVEPQDVHRLVIHMMDPGDTAVFRSGRDACVSDRKSTRLNSSHRTISYAVFCSKNKK